MYVPVYFLLLLLRRLLRRATEFMTLLDRLYEAQNMDLGDITVTDQRQIDVIKLRAIVDNVMEQLPALLELGHVPRVRAGFCPFSASYYT